MKPFMTLERNGLSLHVIPTDKFKFTTIAVNWQTDLTEETATSCALLPHVLMRGCQMYPQAHLIQQALDDLYGASLHVGVAKKGERQVMQFFLKMANEKYIGKGESVGQKALQLLGEIILRPVIAAGGFDPGFVDNEKEQHRKRIDALYDDKIQYAVERCLSEMTKGERYAISRLGKKEDLTKIDGENLFHVYNDLLPQAQVDVLVVGAVRPEQMGQWMEAYLAWPRRGKQILRETEIVPQPKMVKEIVERQDVMQGKLNIGFRTGGITYRSDLYPALVVYNGIFGGFPHSKLFVHVREKASLAYYATSRLDSLKGLMYVQSGIEIANYEKAVSIIKEQFAAMQEGKISEEELQFTKNGLINQYRTLMDSPEGMIDVYVNGLISGRLRTLEEMCEAVQQVTVEDVVAVAQQIHLDTIYFLRNKEERADA